MNIGDNKKLRITNDNKDFISHCVGRFRNWLAEFVMDPVVRELGSRPKEIDTIYKDCEFVQGYLPGQGAYDIKNDEYVNFIDEKYYPLIKRSIIHNRLETARLLEEKRKKTVNADIKKGYEKELNKVSIPTEQDWFKNTVALTRPILTTYFTPQLAIEKSNAIFQKRKNEEKFAILTSPSLINDDLKYYRAICGLLGNPVSFVFFDIDDFKGFNSKYGETRVDRDVLPIFMRVLYTHTYERGHVYRHGGDEFVVILPNNNTEKSIEFMKELKDSCLRSHIQV